MWHKTLESYQSGLPYREEIDHPDGQLWLVTPSELKRLPKNMHVETTDGKVATVADIRQFNIVRKNYTNVGIRGIKSD